MAVRAPDFMVTKRLYSGYRLTLGEGARSVVMDDDSLKNVLSNRDPMDSEKFIMFLSPQEKREWDVFFNDTIQRSNFFVYQPTFNPTPRDGYSVLGRVKNSAIISQKLVDPEDGDRAWEVEIEVEFYSRRPLRAPIELYPSDPSITIVELIHIPRNQRSRFDATYQDPIPLDWTGAVRVDDLSQRRPPRFVMPDINQTSSIIIRYGSPIDLEGFTQLDSMGNKMVPADDAMRTDGRYTFSTRGIIFYNPIGGRSYVYPFRNGEFLSRDEIWQRRGTAQESGARPFGNGWAEARNPALLNNLGFITQEPTSSNLDDLNVLLLSRQLTEDEMDAIIAAQPPF